MSTLDYIIALIATLADNDQPAAAAALAALEARLDAQTYCELMEALFSPEGDCFPNVGHGRLGPCRASA